MVNCSRQWNDSIVCSNNNYIYVFKSFYSMHSLNTDSHQTSVIVLVFLNHKGIDTFVFQLLHVIINQRSCSYNCTYIIKYNTIILQFLISPAIYCKFFKFSPIVSTPVSIQNISQIMQYPLVCTLRKYFKNIFTFSCNDITSSTVLIFVYVPLLS